MSEKITRLSLAEAIEGDRTDWDGIASLSETAIDVSIAADPDSFAVTAKPGRGTARAIARYVVLQDETKRWRWQLIDTKGAVLAQSGSSYRTEADAKEAVALARAAMTNAHAA